METPTNSTPDSVTQVVGKPPTEQTTHNQSYVKCPDELSALSVNLAVAAQLFTDRYMRNASNRGIPNLLVKLKRLSSNVATNQLRSIRDKQLDKQLRLPIGSWRNIRSALRRGEGVRGLAVHPGSNQSQPIPHANNCQVGGENADQRYGSEQVNSTIGAGVPLEGGGGNYVSHNDSEQTGQHVPRESSFTNDGPDGSLQKDPSFSAPFGEKQLTLVQAKTGPGKGAVTWNSKAAQAGAPLTKKRGELEGLNPVGRPIIWPDQPKPVGLKETAPVVKPAEAPVALAPGLERLTLTEVRRFGALGLATRENGETVQVRLGKKWTAAGYQGMAKEIAPGRWEAVAGG